MALISQAELEARIGRPLTSEEASAYPLINAANQTYVERMIGSSVESVTPVTRYYDGGVQHLRIDPCTSITAVTWVDDDQVVNSTFDTTDYTKEPINQTLKTMIRYRPGRFMRGMNNIAITAKFSIYEDTGTLNIVKDALLSALESEIDNSGDIQKESIEGYSVEFAKTETKAALNKLKYLFPEV